MGRASYAYEAKAWAELLDKQRWSNPEAARICGVDPATIGNIVSAKTKAVRFGTMRKMLDGLSKSGVDDQTLDSLFSKGN